MHNVHFISTPIYIFILITLFKNKSALFQKYKYYIIVHILMSVPCGIKNNEKKDFQKLIGLSILEMFHFRFVVVVVHHSGGLLMKLPSYGMYVYRFLTIIHVITVTWSTFDSRTLIYQHNRKDALFRVRPFGEDVPKEIGCHSVSIWASEDPILISNVAIYGVLVLLGLAIVLATVYLINRFLNRAKNMSKETKKLQKMLLISLFGQSAIHVIMIAIPASVQVYQLIFIIYDNNFGTVMLFFVAYHGFFSTCAMIAFTKQLRPKFMEKCCVRRAQTRLENHSGIPSSMVETSVRQL
ncbi:hypothetical protein CRE_16098 [Caenorhabditis remanei]|uniref:G-protein coupled receptors family 1 profile domain-containing protein n=1 Tax=Caenorhabditis remanei TaxID=31234 RepID=E3MBT8_CAERE|nr:hypothetical protein CRE_16098 [Caenorhabditis remanei]